MDELEDEWSASDDALTTREKVTTHNPSRQKPEVSSEDPDAVDGQLTSQGHWTFPQTGSRPFVNKTRLKAHSITSQSGGNVQRPVGACPARHLPKHTSIRTSLRRTRLGGTLTEIGKRVLEFVHEFYEVGIHDLQ